MSNLLFLVHRLPYPPDKGDKVRSYHLLKHLVSRHQVFLGTFVDAAEDARHIGTIEAMVADCRIVRLHPALARLRSLKALRTGEALTLRYYRDTRLSRWVAEVAARRRIDATIVFSSCMAQYAPASSSVPLLVDFVDVDSAKWTDYAAMHPWPLGNLYAREGRKLLAYERSVAARAQRSFFVTPNEAALFRRLAPESAASIEAMGNGVDAGYFSPDPTCVSPFAPGVTPIVFTGAMDYWPNVDAVAWFVSKVLPSLLRSSPDLCFYVVGRNPSRAVRALASESVCITGTVADVRPYLQHAAVVVAPLRLARGVQNKILEAMAMARPVVASAACMAGIDAVAGRDLLGATEADDFADQVGALLRAPDRATKIGLAGRRRVVDAYSWDAHLAGLDPHLAGEAMAECSA